PAVPTARLSKILAFLEFELRQFRIMACPGVYLAAFQVTQPVQAKLFHRKAAEHGTEDHRTTESRVTLLAVSSQVAHKTDGKAVACTGGIVRLFQRKCRHAENAALVHHYCPVLSALYDQRLVPHLEDMYGRPQPIMLVGQLARFRIVDH